MVTLNLLLILAALILSLLSVFRPSQDRREVAWACVCLSLALAVPLIR